ncbi:D-glycerate dehydrogenase [Candidatus Aerophobetes bacterium]|uniref:D-glycerate dehydrogenase n=1 Tax=Aerophobetes bacterium TaxID=2030807 RepID=A0A497E714_UNCAE|nr:MAG: D-glycerate dehydrogenase [Candidatus Aerophobetes bacterium]
MKVFVTRRIPQVGLDLLQKECEVKVNPHERVLTRQELIDGVKEADGLLCLLTDTIDKEVMDANPKLKIISNYAVGYNNIDVEEATRRGIMVTNTPGVLTDTTADLTWAILMCVARRIVEADRFTRQGKFKQWSPMLFLGSDVHHSTLGIVGFGRIGRAVARRARGFEMKVLYTDVRRAPEKVEEELEAKFVFLDELLSSSDFVSLHAPLLPTTYHLIGEKELRRMKRTAFLINAARGPLVDEKALVRALKEGWIAGAALDVYENEPELTPGLAELDNVVLVPHIGSASIATREKMATMAATNLLAGLKGEVPPNLVNREVLKQS